MSDQTKKRLLTIKETVEVYGGTVSMWRSLIWDRQIQYVQIGKLFFFDREDLDRFITAHKRLA